MIISLISSSFLSSYLNNGKQYVQWSLPREKIIQITKKYLESKYFSLNIFFSLFKVLKLLSDKQADDYQRRKKLRELLGKFKDTNANFHKLSTSGRERIRGQTTLESLLQTEGITKDLVTDLTIKTKYISSGHCVVVVAGKLTFL